MRSHRIVLLKSVVTLFHQDWFTYFCIRSNYNYI